MAEHQASEIQDKIKHFASHGAKLLAQATAKILSRMLAWGFIGFVLALVTSILLWNFDLLTITVGDWNPWIFKVLFVFLYLITGVGVMGYIGMLRGIGRTILFVGLEHGLVFYLLDNILDRLGTKLYAHEGTAQKLDDAQAMMANLPLAQWEDNIKSTISTYLNDDGEDALGQVKGIKGKLARLVRTILCKKIEAYLLKIVREEHTTAADGSNQGGGISMAKVRQLAIERASAFFEAFIEKLMNKYLLFGTLALMLLFSIAPVTIYLVKTLG